jgi:flavin-dependent dehydrogenase
VLETEVLVVGAGPAGATAALNLAPTRTVVLIDARTAAAPRIGESVLPVLNRILAEMGLLEEFCRQGHAPCHGNRSRWGSAVPAEMDFLRDPDGHGWHIDRRKFENWLRGKAVERGAIDLHPVQFRSILRDGRRWRVRIDGTDRAEAVIADYVIDAGGRSAPLARCLGARKRVFDRLVCGWLHGDVTHPGTGAGLTYVEAEYEGWWYTAPLPDNRRILAFHTDADLPAACDARNRSRLLARAAMCPELSSALRKAGFTPDAVSGFTAAHTAVLEPCAASGWMAIGDAALSLDPLSAQGLLHAMFTALMAAEAVDRYLKGDVDPADQYTQVVTNIYRTYCQHLKSQYQTEDRWPNSLFWQRRHSR